MRDRKRKAKRLSRGERDQKNESKKRLKMQDQKSDPKRSQLSKKKSEKKRMAEIVKLKRATVQGKTWKSKRKMLKKGADKNKGQNFHPNCENSWK